MTTGYNQCGRTPVDGKKSINPLSLNNLEGDCYTLNICVSPSNSYVEVLTPSMLVLGGGSFPGGSDGEEPAYNAGDLGLIPGSGRFPWRREWYPTPVFLPGEFYGQKSLVGYSLRGHEELNTTEQLTLSLSEP